MVIHDRSEPKVPDDISKADSAHQFHGQEGNAVVDTVLVRLHDRRMIERSDRSRFDFEPRQPLGGGRLAPGQYFQSYTTLQRPFFGFEDPAHATVAE